MNRARVVLVAGVLASIFLAGPLAAQTITVQTTTNTVVLEGPRGDSFVLGPVAAGTLLEILDQRPGWYQVRPAKLGETPWERGWIQAGFVELVGVASVSRRPPGEAMIRGFGQAGGSLFNARDSFETILGSTFGPTLGGGAQVGFANGVFIQATVARFRKTGSRAIVSGSQVFRLETPHVITVTPIQFSVGYREASHRIAPYVGGGAGWHLLKEETPSLLDSGSVEGRHVGYHVLGGVEYPLGPWLALGGEVQWSAVPGLLGKSGVSAAFEEGDLGETTFRFKVIFGR